MPSADVVVESTVERSYRVEQIAGMFDVPLEDKLRHSWHVELPLDTQPWTIGAIVGPSGAGKSVIAQKLWPKEYHRGFSWSKTKSILDAFSDDASIKDITAALTSVGFSSPPSWTKPFSVLSNGEKFRVELARIIMSGKKLAVVDEYTSVVDRTVAQIGSAAVAKTLRRRQDMQLVVLSCHYDILEWLAPDWIYDLRDQSFQWAHLHRPDIELRLHRTKNPAVWRVFAQHHYLNTKTLPASTYYVATIDDQLVGVVVVRAVQGFRGLVAGARVVVLPDFQGVGIGAKMTDAVAQLYKDQGIRFVATAAHPARVADFQRNPRWVITAIKKTGGARQGGVEGRGTKTSAGRAVVSVEYIGDTAA